MIPVQQRFWAKVDLSDPGGCWLWTASTRNGYGQFWAGNRTASGHPRMDYAHRFAYEWLVGPIPPELELDHLCRVRLCVNPDHLEPVSHRENLLRGETQTAKRAAQTHCIHGHAFTEENTYVKRNGTRACRTCIRRWERERERGPR